MGDSAEAALACSLLTPLTLGGLGMCFEFVKLSALPDIRREQPHFMRISQA